MRRSSASRGGSPLTTRRRPGSVLVLGALVVVGIVLVIVGRPARPAPVSAPLPEAGRPHLPGTMPGSDGSTGLPPPRHQTDLPASSLRIPALGVTARIGRATEEKGALIPPQVPTEVGLWSGSAALDAGSGEVTIVGHVNWRGMPPFAFGRLAYLHDGDLIYTSDARDAQTAWRVRQVSARTKAGGVDPAAFTGPHGPRELTLITCGGTFDPRIGSYSDNVYVYAVRWGTGLDRTSATEPPESSKPPRTQ